MSKTCTTCGQVLPKVKSGDMVRVVVRPGYAGQDYEGLAIVTATGPLGINVVMITGVHKGYSNNTVGLERITVVHGYIHIDGLQMQGQSHVGPSVFDHKI